MTVCAYRALEVHQTLATRCNDRHGLDPVFSWIRVAMGDDLTPNLRWEQNGKFGNVVFSTIYLHHCHALCLSRIQNCLPPPAPHAALPLHPTLLRDLVNTTTTDLVGGCHESVGHSRKNLSVEGRTATPGCGGHRLQHTCVRRGRGTGRGVVQGGRWVLCTG